MFCHGDALHGIGLWPRILRRRYFLSLRCAGSRCVQICGPVRRPLPPHYIPFPCLSLLPQGTTPLFAAASEGKLAIVRLLIGAGADVNLCGPASHSPSGKGDSGPLRGAGKTYSPLAFTPLQSAAANGHLTTVQYLCSKVCVGARACIGLIAGGFG